MGAANPLNIAREHPPWTASTVQPVAVSPRHPYRRAFSSALAALAGTTLILAALRVVDQQLHSTPPPFRPVDVRAVFVDDTPVRVTISVGWEKLPFIATADAVRRDVALWRRLQFEDWDRIPQPLREQGLDAMLLRYRHVLADPEQWDRMSAFDWDEVPQPLRALAFRHMVEYWSGYYQVGAEFALPRRTVADTLASIVMSESWFDHRAVNTSAWGNRDLGLAQASDRARDWLRTLYGRGEVDVYLPDEDYFDPWAGTRFVALWMRLELQSVGGDLNTAVRAYYRGSERALQGEGMDYLEGVLRRRSRFIRNIDPPPAWDFLWRRDRALVEAAWPWFSIPGESTPAAPVGPPSSIRNVAPARR